MSEPSGAASFWLETSRDGCHRPSLKGRVRADVAILGGGYTGLWTAHELLRRDPSLRVVILEREYCGFGASGRHGGWCYPTPGVTLSPLARRFGVERVQNLVGAYLRAVDSVSQLASAKDVAADHHAGGMLLVARGAHEAPSLNERFEDLRRFGPDGHYRLLEHGDVRDRIDVPDAVLGLYTPHAATVHAGKLVRGLARAVEDLGGIIHEHSEVVAVAPRGDSGARPALMTSEGRVEADAVVLAGEAYLSRLAGFQRRLLPVYSHIVLTEPLSHSRWKDIGWAGRECLASMRLTVDYLSRTADGRIVIGGRGAPYHLGSRVRPGFDRDPQARRRLRLLFEDWFPSLRGVELTHHWGGPIAMNRDWLPSVTYDESSGLASAYGFGGNGVATSRVCAEVLADLILHGGVNTPPLPFTGHVPRRWEPEPLRWLGVRYVQWALERLDNSARLTGQAPTGRTLAERLTRH
jgi:glycine/D-amino acid oxidase-like deaminating enzyme